MGRDSLSESVVIGQGVTVLNWKGKFRWDIRKKFFTVRVMRHWNRLPRYAVDAPSLKVFKTRVNGLWATWSSGRCPCPWQWLALCISKVPSYQKHSMILWLIERPLVFKAHLNLSIEYIGRLNILFKKPRRGHEPTPLALQCLSHAWSGYHPQCNICLSTILNFLEGCFHHPEWYVRRAALHLSIQAHRIPGLLLPESLAVSNRHSSLWVMKSIF